MSIWKVETNLEKLNNFQKKNTIGEVLDIEFTEVGEDFLRGKMPVDHRTHQPMGILHGGASVVLAESLGSMASNLCIDNTRFYCVGLDINANHLRAVRSGYVWGTAKPIHLGRSTQVWEIKIEDDEARPVCVSRLTMSVLAHK